MGTTKKHPAEALLRILKAMGDEIDPAMPWQQGLVFLTVALAGDEGIDMVDLGREVALSKSAVSRNVGALGEWHRMGRPGLGLVETFTDYEDRRRKPVRLTAKGKAALRKILNRL